MQALLSAILCIIVPCVYCANLIGLAFSPRGATILATGEAVYDVDLGVEALNLF